MTPLKLFEEDKGMEREIGNRLGKDRVFFEIAGHRVTNPLFKPDINAIRSRYAEFIRFSPIFGSDMTERCPTRTRHGYETKNTVPVLQR